jgi:hypothetical protein
MGTRLLMKRILLWSVVFVLSALASFGQDAKIGQVVVAPKPALKESDQKPVPLTVRKPADDLFGKAVLHQGYFMDLVRAEQKRALFDLRTPVNPEMDFDNLIFYPGTDKVQAIVLFRVKF